jgi:hypothetical protein
MYRHWHRFSFSFPHFGFWFGGPPYFPRKDEYIRMLEDYKQKLEAELKEVNKELEEMKKTA